VLCQKEIHFLSSDLKIGNFNYFVLYDYSDQPTADHNIQTAANEFVRRLSSLLNREKIPFETYKQASDSSTQLLRRLSGNNVSAALIRFSCCFHNPIIGIARPLRKHFFRGQVKLEWQN
jgi:hypothetical protein